MIDPNDDSTLPLLPLGQQDKRKTRKVARSGKTAAQRKRDQRARDGWILVNAAATKDYSKVTLTGLLEQLAVAVSNKNVELVKVITKELLRRAR